MSLPGCLLHFGTIAGAGPVWPAAGQLGLPAPSALVVRCLAGVLHFLGQGRLESRLWSAIADRLGWLAVAGAGPPTFGDVAFGSSWRRPLPLPVDLPLSLPLPFPLPLHVQSSHHRD